MSCFETRQGDAQVLLGPSKRSVIFGEYDFVDDSGLKVPNPLR